MLCHYYKPSRWDHVRFTWHFFAWAIRIPTSIRDEKPKRTQTDSDNFRWSLIVNKRIWQVDVKQKLIGASQESWEKPNRSQRPGL